MTWKGGKPVSRPMGNQTELLALGVHPSVVFKLGEDLITDETQALLELVKNCYDADAAYARIEIDTSATSQDTDSTGAPVGGVLLGRLSVTDNGDGMTRDDIVRGWLTLSNSRKRAFKRGGNTTNKGRTPLGDKGLGRLGAQRLGSRVEIVTRPKGAGLENRVRIRWADFARASTLSDVPVALHTVPTKRSKGTTVAIEGLADPSLWSGTRLEALQRGLSTLIHPYGRKRGFDVTLTVDGAPSDLGILPRLLRETADSSYRLRYANGALTMLGDVSIDLLRPPNKSDQPLFESLVGADNGGRFATWLEQKEPRQLYDLNIARSSAPTRFLAFEVTRILGDIEGVGWVDGAPADPGPFSGEIDTVDLGRDPTEVLGSRDEFRDYVRRFGGIRVYRDGFGINLPWDWLGLGRGATSNVSYYGLKPGNVLGFIDISARDNPQLEETTDREGFRAGPYFDSFYSLLREFVKTADRLQGFLRRQFLQFRTDHAAVRAKVPPRATSEDLLTDLDRGLSRTRQAQAEVKNLQSQISQVDEAATTLTRSRGPSDSVLLSSEAALNRLRSAVAQASEITESIESRLADLEDQRSLVEVVQSQVALARAQLEETYETMSLGLTAEAITHEILNVADGLARRTAEVRRHVSRRGLRDARLLEYMDYAASLSAALKRQLLHLDPSLRYMRERRERFGMGPFLSDLAEYHNTRWRSIRLRMSVHVVPDFDVHMNRGKLLQVMDNLVLNSEYWLRAEVDKGAVSEGLIKIVARRPVVVIEDNGPGVDQSVEASLFEPFVTTKRRETGRGLGLFVVTQLLSTVGGSIRLLDERNAHGRPYRFEIDLSSVIAWKPK